MRAEKKNIVEELLKEIEGKNPILFTDYSRVKVNSLNRLRQSLKDAGCGYRVVRNRLFYRAVENTEAGKCRDLFKGPVAVAYGGKDVVEAVKILVNFVKENPGSLSIKGGIVDKEYTKPEGLEELAKLPSRDILLARFTGQMNAPIGRLAAVLGGTLQKLVCLLNGIREKKAGE